jgi:glycerol-3-phosphate dehydrogenase
MNDARVNLGLALTAAAFGATIANHVEVVELLKETQKIQKDGAEVEQEKLVGAKLRDRISGQEWTVRAKVIVNAAGAFAGRFFLS